MAKTVEIEETEIQAAGLPEEPKSGVWYVVLAWFLGVSGYVVCQQGRTGGGFFRQ